MPVLQRLPILCACCCLLLPAGQTARADFLGVAEVVRTDLTICQDTSQDEIDEPLNVCNFFAVFDDPTDILLNTGNSLITTSDPAGFFQHPLIVGDRSPDCDDISLFPTLACDSFITIGVSCDDGFDLTFPDANWDPALFNMAGQTRGGWFNGDSTNGQGDAGNYPNNLVLFLQTATARGEIVSGYMHIFWWDTVDNELGWALVLLSCPPPCPADLSGDRRVGSFDLAMLLSSWGPNPGDPADFDGDGVVGASDLAILLGEWGPCCNGVGVPGEDRPDADGDAVHDGCDNCPELFNPIQNDCDENGMGDTCTIADGIEEDCNDNGLPDNCEDCNENDIADECDLADGTSPDCNENAVPDECEADCNENGVADECDVSDGTSPDCNENGIPDECETDCNENGTPDDCDVADGTSADCDGNGAPDECQDTSADCNDNGIWDACDIDQGTSSDCDGDFVPDECQDTSTDCNNNGTWDACDIDEGTSPDGDGNGIPDECEENEVLYADDDAPGDPAPGDPSESDPEEDGSLEHPFDGLQEAIDAAISGDTILVFPGTYFENIDLLGKGITLHSSDGPSVTTIDAGDSGSVIKCINGEDSDTVIDGFTVTGGRAIGGFSNNLGGGMYNFASSPTVNNCTFSGNVASYYGGGMYNGSGSSPTVTNCTFSGNATYHGGGGMYNGTGTSPTVTNCTFSGNTTTYYGGGMHNSASSPTVTNCTFSGNKATYYGGGMVNRYSTVLTVSNCTFSGNSTINYGGGMYNHDSTILSVSNCTFSGNDAVDGRALAFNSFNDPSQLSMTNCILWDGGDEVWNNDNSLISIAYSDVQGGWPGEGNIDADPLFVDADGPDDVPGNEDDNLRLQPGSPTIDAADNDAVPPDWLDLDGDGDTDEPIPFDLDGNPRFVNEVDTRDTGQSEDGCPTIDIGAYEFQDGIMACCVADFDDSGDVGAADLGVLLGSWGPCPGCPADLNGDGVVGSFDLALMLGEWGPCP